MQTQARSVAQIYNLLPDISEADAHLTRLGRTNTIGRLLNIIRKHGLQQDVGVRLLHKHNLINEEEIMAEDSAFDNTNLLLITKPVLSKNSLGLVANSWQLTPTGFCASEHSSTHLLSNAKVDPDRNPDFFDEFGDALLELNASEILGPALNCGAFVTDRAPDNSILVELTALDDRANVVKFEARQEVDFNAMVETAWVASGDAAESSSEENSVTTKGCVRICPSVQNPPVHQGTYIHKKT